jgi:hypothetical protein
MTRILVVENEAVHCKMLAVALRGQRYEVDTAESRRAHALQAAVGLLEFADEAVAGYLVSFESTGPGPEPAWHARPVHSLGSTEVPRRNSGSARIRGYT